MLYPQNGDRIVTVDSVTSLHPIYLYARGTWQKWPESKERETVVFLWTVNEWFDKTTRISHAVNICRLFTMHVGRNTVKIKTDRTDRLQTTQWFKLRINVVMPSQLSVFLVCYWNVRRVVIGRWATFSRATVTRVDSVRDQPWRHNGTTNMERKCADTIGTVLVLWAGHFQC